MPAAAAHLHARGLRACARRLTGGLLWLRSMRAVLVKMALDQLVMSPIFLLIFFTAVKLLEGQVHKLREVLREKFLKTLAAGYLLWPLALIISFRYVPTDLRILYLNCVQARMCSSCS